MITKEQALTERFFYYPNKTKGKVDTWRRNGKTQVWKTRPNDFRVPVKFGLYAYGQITHDDAGCFYVSEEEARAALR